jgi:endoglucanase
MKRKAIGLVVGISLLVTPALGLARSTPAADRSLAPDTQFLVPPIEAGAVQQIRDLVGAGRTGDATLIEAMVAVSHAVWVTQGSPAEARDDVKRWIKLADKQHAVPVLVAYNVPGRDCGGYSGGGAHTTAEYTAWVDGFANAIGGHRAVVVLEPDGLANIDCLTPEQRVARFVELNYAVDRFESRPHTSVYLDAGHSNWQSVGTIAQRLVEAGVERSQGFFLNVSNYQPTAQQVQYGRWISNCIAFAENPDEGGWRLGHYDYCASQYYPASPGDYSTWHLSDEWYAANMGLAVATTHFVVDTSRNGQGPWHPSVSYPDAQDWCNPPGRGLGAPPTADAGAGELVDAYLWVKVPGESDGQCNRGVAGSTTDPEWGGITDPAAGQWFPQQALELAQLASPPLQP